ncbi:MAG: hypothetical protein V3T42_00700 [Nitrospirales bacterium]
MKISTRQTPTFSPTKRPDSDRKLKRRHTRLILDSLRPTPYTLPIGSLSSCPKCQGHVDIEAGESLDSTVVRCLNCGWQPQYQTPVIHETEEAKTSRARSAEFVSDWEWHRLPKKL